MSVTPPVATYVRYSHSPPATLRQDKLSPAHPAGLWAVARLHDFLPVPAGADPTVHDIFQSRELARRSSPQIITDPRTVAAFKLSFGTSALAALFNAFPGLLVAWTLVRYPFPGRRIVDGLVDLPFALPTAVAGICLSAVYAENGWIGSHLYHCILHSARAGQCAWQPF